MELSPIHLYRVATPCKGRPEGTCTVSVLTFLEKPLYHIASTILPSAPFTAQRGAQMPYGHGILVLSEGLFTNSKTGR